jgi:hypothetical protein
MNRKAQRTQGKDALEILEEAVHLLRRVPGRVFASYYIGSASFVLAFLYFWADMSGGAFARSHVVGASLLVALLFLWMKCWQAVFAARVRSLLTGGAASPWSFRRVLRLVLAQTAIQPAGLLVLPLALLVTLPFGWVYAYYQNVTLFGSGQEPDLKAVTRKARGQAMLFQKQNHAVLAVLALFGMFVFLNIAGLLYFAPQLAHLLTGSETVFSRADWRVVNTTFLAASLGMTYLALDPIVKCVYVLRCFYGESLLNGEDLEAEMKNITFKPKIVSPVLAFILLLAASLPPSPALGREPLSPEKLDQSISEVVGRSEYAWRMPRQKQDADREAGPFAKFLQGAADTVKSWLRPVKTWIRKALEWLVDRVFSRMKTGSPERPREGGWPQSVFILLYGLMTLAASVLAVMAFRMWQQRKRRVVMRGEEAVARTPDLTRQDITADELPANRWLELGRELMKKGDLRLALRAFYLASLSRLAEEGRITIAAFKSNREYERELSRRAHTMPELVSAFSQNVSTLESAWYGMHDVTVDAVRQFIENQERIMADAQEA